MKTEMFSKKKFVDTLKNPKTLAVVEKIQKIISEKDLIFTSTYVII